MIRVHHDFCANQLGSKFVKRKNYYQEFFFVHRIFVLSFIQRFTRIEDWLQNLCFMLTLQCAHHNVANITH